MRLLFLMAVVFCLPLTVQGQNSFSLDSASTLPGSVVDVVVRLDNQAPVQGFQCAISWDSSLFSFLSTHTNGTDAEASLSP